MKNHSSVHLLQKSLQELLGSSVHQAGSKVDEDALRFDFNYHGQLSDELILKVEELVNEKINAGYETKIEYLSLDEAKKRGAMALFSDKYGSIVRMVTIGPSVELCAGTHVKNTSEIEKIAIVSLINKGADTFRIEGTTKNNIEEMLEIAVKPYYDEIMKLLEKAKKLLEEATNANINITFDYNMTNINLTSFNSIIEYKNEIIELKEKIKEFEKNIKEEKIKKSIENITAFTANMEVINGVKTMIAITEDYEVDIIKQISDAICNKYEDCFALLCNVKNNNVNIIAKSNSNKINCGAIVKDISIKCKGNGGGSKNFAQGGGSDASDLSAYLTELKETKH